MRIEDAAELMERLKLPAVEGPEREAVISAWIREGGNGGRLIEYDELALRLSVSISTAKDMKARGTIAPAYAAGRNVARFHWPSVQTQLEKRRERIAKSRPRRTPRNVKRATREAA
jgi:hypothetical protein